MKWLSTDAIGPTIAAEVVRNAFIAVFLASLMIILYLAKQFALGGAAAGFRYGICAVIALLHNVIVVTGFFAIMGFLRGWIVDSLFVTAILTVIGYSVHDTIVVYDRIRENLRNRQRGETFEQVANRSITQTFDRSMTTGITVLLALSALLVFGGPSTKLFNWALLIGIAFGTYASIFVASSLVVLWEQAAGAKTAARRTAPADVRLRSAAERASSSRRSVAPSPERSRPVPAGTAARPSSRVTVPVGESVDDDGDTEAAGARQTATAGRQQIKPKRKRRM
jgi:preprotein translocase SecF subunit